MRKIAIEGLRPFTRIIWRSRELKKEWEEKIREASGVYSIAEWRMVSEGLRRCGTLHVNKANYEGILNLLTKDGLFFKPISRTARYQGFSHKHITPRGGEDYDVYGVMATDRRDALRFAELSKSRLADMHIQIGDLLGYPKCCSEAFTKRWREGIIDPMFEAASMVSSNISFIKMPETHIETNQMMRYFGVRVTSHLPCSLACKETILIGRKWIDVMRRIDSKALEGLEELLMMPLRWDAYRGILIVTTPAFRGVTTTGYTKERKIIEIGELDW